MKVKIKSKDMILHFFIDNYYIFVILFYFINLKKPNFPVGVCSALLMILLGIILVVSGKIKTKVSKLDALVLVYLFYCLGSVILVVMNGISVGIYVKAVTNSLFPVVFYFCAKENRETFYKRFLYAVNICCIVGIYLLITMPTWYFLYCIANGYSFTRLSSCIGSTAVGSLSAIAIIISIWQIYNSKGKKGKLFYLFSIVYAFASMQRSAWIIILISLVILHYLMFFKWRTLKFRYLCIEITGILIAGIVARERIISMIARWLREREVSGGYGMLSSRTGQWEAALGTSNLLFGNGYGTVGHKAIGEVQNIVTDGSWVCLLCEIGLIGIGLFLIILFFVAEKGLRSIKVLFLPLAIIVGICLQSIGSNMFEYQIIMPIFWYAIGHITYSGQRKKRMKKYESARNLSAPIS